MDIDEITIADCFRTFFVVVVLFICSRSSLLGACNSHNKPMKRHFYRPVYFSIFSREIGQFQSTWARFGEEKTMWPHVNMSKSCRHVNISPCLWFQLVTEVPVGIWIWDNFKLKIYRSVKAPCWWVPVCSYVSCLFRFQIPADALNFPHQSMALHLKVMWSKIFL